MKEVNILSYGSPENITGAVKNALFDIRKSGEETTLVFPKDDYHFFMEDSETRVFHTSNTDSKRFPEKKIAFLIEDMENLTVDGCGSRFIVHGNMMFIAVIRSRNIKLQSFSWDYPCPETVEMRTVAVGRDYADFRMPPHELWRIKGRNIIWYETSPKTGEIYRERKNFARSCCVCHLDLTRHSIVRKGLNENPFLAIRRKIKKLDERTVRIKYAGKIPKFIREGNVFILCPNRDRMTSGAFFWESENISAERIHPLYLNGFSWLVQMCKDISFKKCSFTPDESTGRFVTSFADSLHVAGCAGHVLIEDCDFSHSLDDSVNIHGSFMRVEKLIDSHTAKLIYCHSQQGGFRQFFPGDKVVFYSRDTVEGAENERRFTVKSASNPATGDLVSCEVVFEEELPRCLGERILTEGRFVAENVTYAPDVIIRGCKFSYVPTRGVLCTSGGNVLIENNEFFGMSMASVYISCDTASWYESGPVRDMTIRGNIFYILKTGERGAQNKGGIFINPVTKTVKPPESTSIVHRNITIDSNEFYMEHDKAVNAERVDNLRITNNSVKKFDSQYTDEEITAFRLSACKNVVISDNTFDEGVNPEPEITAMERKDIRC